ncbi:MAG: MarR family transcriptional regulator [Solirubrobacteraceae bacterium]|jgi:DNA-binding MarR family transcriptional regulator
MAEQGPPATGTHGGHDASLMYTIGRLNQGIRHAMRERLVAWELSVQEYTTLSVLAARPGLSNAQLARRALVTPQSMIEILGKLERRQLVSRKPDPRRSLILRADLTHAGHSVLAAADPTVAAIQDSLFDGVPQRDLSIALRAMTSAMTNLSRSQG